MVSPEDAFWLLAEASEARQPHPYRETRGKCPAHGDHDYGLSFRLTSSGNLVAHCFAQDCTMERIADSIGVSPGAFFADGGGKFAQSIAIEWTEMPALELLKLVPLGYDFDTQVECVMRTLDLDLEYATMPWRELTKTDQLALAGIWLAPGYSPDRGNWWDWHDKLLTTTYKLNQTTRTDPAAEVSAIPRRP